jgi:hypothetical protein
VSGNIANATFDAILLKLLLRSKGVTDVGLLDKVIGCKL